jgi:hypothetical protein
MTLFTVDVYGAPQYGDIGRPPAGIVFHTPEWGTTPTLQNAIECAKWQATSGNTSGGSYHGILGHGGQYTDDMATCSVADHWVMVRSVYWNKAAGGLTGNHTPPSQGGVWAPDRFPWMKEMMSAAAYADPNRWMQQISISGSASYFVANGYSKGLLIRLAEWVLTLEKNYNYDAVLTLHQFWQTNRSDPGPADLADQIMVEYEKLVNPTPVPVPAPTPEPTPVPPPAPDVLALKNEALDRIITLRIPALKAELDQLKAAVDQVETSVKFTRSL